MFLIDTIWCILEALQDAYLTTNSFSKTTGWGYNDRVGGSMAPRAYSYCKGNVSGMDGQTTITVEFTFGAP